MLSEELRRRISELNRKNIKVWPMGSPPPGMGKKPQAETAVPENLEAALKGEVIEREQGQFLRISHQFRDLQANAGKFLDRYQFVFLKGGISVPTDTMHADLIRFLQTPYERIMYLDIETCGLSSSPIFLVGVMYPTDNDFILEQLFARDYTEEHPLMAYLIELMDRTDVLVTFNGKTFDYPYIKERGLLHHVFFDPDQAHFDLLHESRRRWKEYLPDCKLQTIERYILKRHRSGDIPGEEIPEVYHNFVRTGEATRIKSVLQHNMLDLISMAEIVLHMVAGGEEEE